MITNFWIVFQKVWKIKKEAPYCKDANLITGKPQYFNQQMLNFLVNFQLDADLKDNKAALQQILNYGSMAA